MSVLIKGAEMPKCCEICPFNYDYFRCNALGEKFDDKEEIDFETQRLSDCPLVEIPPHGRLIDADKLLERIKRDLDTKCIFNDEEEAYQSAVEDAEFLIDCAPSVIESGEGART